MRFFRAGVLVLTVMGTTLLFGGAKLGPGGLRLGPIKWRALPTQVPDVVARASDLGASDPDRMLHVAVSLRYGDETAIQDYVDRVSDPNDPDYMNFLTPEAVGERFGLDKSDVQRVADFLESAGLKVDLIGKNRLTILAEGTVSAAETAFNTTIREFQAMGPDEAGNPRFFSFTTAPQLPTTLAPLVIDVSGLESFTQPQRRILTPTQTRTLYNLAPIYNAGRQGQGRTVAISNWDGFRLTNVPLYYSQYGLPTPAGGVGSNITVIPISGGSGSGPVQGEGDLDIQMALGMAPLSNLRIYDGGGNDLIGVLTAEANDNLADVISESWGWSLFSSTATAAHNLHLSMSAQGITYMAASGDNGTTIEPYSYPNYDPEVLMVGGTIATVNGSGNRTTSEVAWSGSGGGWSNNAASFNVLPSWQHGPNVPTTINHRLTPDVAFHSYSSTGAYYFFLNGSLASGWYGTSFASPMFAGALADAEQQIIAQGGLPPNGAGKRRFGRIQNLIYFQHGRSDVWYDIQLGGSTGTLPNGSPANPGPAWDFCTGWGPMNVNAFVASVGAGVLPAPTNLVATPGNGQVSLTWSSSGAMTYNVKRATVSGGPYTTIASSTTVGYIDTGLTNGTTYFYVVAAVNVYGEGPNSSQASATPTAIGYYPRRTATSHLASGIAGGCLGDIYTCQILRNEDLLPRPAAAGIVMHGGSHTPGCDAWGVTGCTEYEVEVNINDPTMFWADWCLLDQESYTLTATDRYDFRGVSVRNCTPNPFNFDYEFLCRTSADCASGDTCSPANGRCYPPSITPVTLEAGYAHSVSVHTDGTVWGWGWNADGQLGDGTLTSRSGPVRAGTLTGVVEVGAGVFHTVALKSDGTVWAWGGNSEGQLGDGTTTSRSTPGQVPGLTGILAVTAGAKHNLAVKSDGTVWAWGDNWGGQIGDGTTNDRLTPFQVPGLSGVLSVSGGFYHSAAVRSDGTVSTWGRNAEGELGDGTHTDRYAPGPVPGLTGVMRASCGAYFTMAITSSGGLKGWGHNYFGQLGDGTNLERTTPVTALAISSVARVAAGSAFTLAVRTDGTVWSWGQNVAGQLGTGNTTDRNTPAAIALSGIAEVAAGEDHSLARSTAGVVYGWGKNLNYQIGVGPWPRTTPAAITDETQPAPVVLMAPVGGETWSPGSAQTVSWTGAGPISVKISYDGGASYTTLTASTSLQDVPITVPANWSTARGRVRIDRVGTPASSSQTGPYLRIHPPQSHPWLATTVDAGAPVVGEFASIAIDPFGRTGIAYTDRTNGDLKFALRSGTGWTIEVVDSVNSSGWYTSLAFGADGTPRISYMDGTRTYLRYAYKTTAGAWVKEDVADTGCTLPTSLGFDLSDRPFIAIQDCSMTMVRVFAKSGTWSQIWSVSGASPSLKMQGNLPRISYFLHTANPTQLHYVAASGTYGSFTWTDIPVPGTDGANGSSITIDALGDPRISFYATSAGAKTLRMAKRVSGGWSVDVVDASVGDIGNWNSIALDPSSRPRISYLANGLVKVAEWNGSAWQLDAVDGSGDTPAATALAVDAAGNDRVAYFDTPGGNLRYALSQADATAPATPTLLADAGRTTIAVSWTAPGDDGSSGTASVYEFRKSSSPINASNFAQATLVPLGSPSPVGFGECTDFSSLTSCSTYYFGLKVLDDVGNESSLATVQMTTDCSGNQELICF